MLKRYGVEGWPALRKCVVETYGEACRTLLKVLTSGKVRGIGKSRHDAAPRPIASDEWGRDPRGNHIELKRNLLTAPFGQSEALFPTISVVSVSVEDLERECAPQVEAAHPQKKQVEAAHPQKKMGRPPAQDWAEIQKVLKTEILKLNSFPGPNEEFGWRSQMDAVRFITPYLDDGGVGGTALKTNVRRMLADLARELPEVPGSSRHRVNSLAKDGKSEKPFRP